MNTRPDQKWQPDNVLAQVGQPYAGDSAFEYLPDAALVVSGDTTITHWNQAAARMFGFSAKEIIGSSADRLAGAGSIIGPAIWRAFGASGVVHEPAMRGRRKDGREFDLELSLMQVPNQASVVITARDVSRQVRNDRRAAAEYAVTQALAESTSSDEAFRGALAAVATELAFEYAALWLLRERQHLVCMMSWYGNDASLEYFDRKNRHMRLSRGAGLPGRVWQRLEPVWIENLKRDSNFPRARVALETELRSGVAVPVLVGGEFHGVLEFFARDVRMRDDSTLRTILGIGSELGQYIKRLQAEDALRAYELRIRDVVSQQNAAQDNARDHEVDHQAGHID